MRPNENRVIPEFLFELTKKSFFIERLSKLVKVASYPAVTESQILEAEIPLPSISLQKKFSSVTRNIETLRQKLRESERYLQELFNSLMQRYFG